MTLVYNKNERENVNYGNTISHVKLYLSLKILLQRYFLQNES